MYYIEYFYAFEYCNVSANVGADHFVSSAFLRNLKIQPDHVLASDVFYYSSLVLR